MRRHAKVAIVVSVLLSALALGVSGASAAAPTVTIEPAADVSYTTAKLKGTVDPKGWQTTYRFEFVSQAKFLAGGFKDARSAGEATIEGTGVQQVEAAIEGFTEISPNTTYYLRLVADNYDGRGEANAPTFKTKFLPAPTVATSPATEIKETSAVLNGTLDPNGGALGNFVFLEYSRDPSKGWTFAGQEYILTEDPGPVPVSAKAEGLVAGVEYQFRLVTLSVTGSSVQTLAPHPSFTTIAIAKPTPVIEPVSAITTDSAHLEATIDPNAPGAVPQDPMFDVNWRFECTPQCPNLPGDQLIAGDDESHSVEFDATELEPNTEYEVRLVAKNAADPVVATTTFKTDSVPPVFIGVGTVGALTHNSARLTAHVDPNNAPTTATFEYATDPGFTDAEVAPTGPGSTVSGNRNEVAYADVAGLAPATTYYWRVATSSPEGGDGEATAPEPFTTWPAPAPDQGGVGVGGVRRYELVSPAKKYGEAGAIPSASGDRAYINFGAGTDDGRAAVANRTPGGWVLAPGAPPVEEVPGEKVVSSFLAKGATPEIGRMLFRSSANNFGAAEVPSLLFRYSTDTKKIEPGMTLPPEAGLGHGYVSWNAEHAVFVYEGMIVDVVEPGSPVEVGFLPDGSSPPCGVRFADGFQEAPKELNWISSDGNRFFFYADDCVNGMRLYMREGGVGGSTTLISGPASGPEAVPTLQQASSDGASVVYTTVAKLDPDDDNETNDVYRYVHGSGNRCVTCSAPEAGVEGRVMASDDTERVYFVSRRALASGATVGEANIYEWRAEAPSQIRFVAPGNQNQAFLDDSLIALSHDGSVLILDSADADLDRLSGDSNQGADKEGAPVRFIQRYRFDSRSRSLVCMSCSSASGNAVGGAGTFDRNGRTLSDDGSIYVFNTADSLVSEDRNETVDAYEWRDGRVGLISGAQTPFSEKSLFEAPEAVIFGISTDGRDLFFGSPKKLLPEVEDPYGNVFDARIGGGFERPVPPTPCAGDGCQRAPSSPPGTVSPNTAGFSGPGNRGRSRASRAGAGPRSPLAKARKAVGAAKTKPQKAKARKQLRRAEADLGACRKGGNS